ncbi:mechanosensitive ion channel [Candidatus Saccharibacteria bacterium]|nr:mechanosensitive ion channel [Candidatus Saccharibacteria bacterium]
MVNIFGAEISMHKIINSVIYVMAVFAVYMILKHILRTVVKKAETKKIGAQQKQKIQTVTQMIMSLLRYALVILVVLVVLADFGVNVGSLIAGLGILTAIFGLAFQDMIKDIIAGVTIIIEDQFSVGDTVEISSFKGTVSSVGLKTTEITGKGGEVKIVSNRNMDGLINYSRKQD